MRLIPTGLRRKLCKWCPVALAVLPFLFFLHSRINMDTYIPNYSDTRPTTNAIQSESGQYMVTNVTTKIPASTKSNNSSVNKIHSTPVRVPHVRSVVKNAKNKASWLSHENPSAYLNSNRFDVMIKIVYAYFYTFAKEVPEPVVSAYKEHLRVWNGFHEYCGDRDKRTFDAKMPCMRKNNASDFIKSFNTLIESIQNKGFMSNTSRVPVYKNGLVQNGAHRLSASTVLSVNVTLEHLNYTHHVGWGFQFYKDRGFSLDFGNLVMLEWMKIQLKLKGLKMKVSILSVFSDDISKDKMMRDIVLKECTKDNTILYETNTNVTQLGMRQLITHMYGNQPWLDTKIEQMLHKFKSDFFKVRFMFFFAKSSGELTKCKHDVRKLYNDHFFKSSAHIPDTPEESLILSEMILNPNSIRFLNYGKNGQDCERIAKEIGIRSSAKPINTLPGIYLGRDDVMIDSGSVLHFFDLRKRTDVDILFLKEVDAHILGMQRDTRLEAHAFKSNAISRGRAWGEDHFNKNVITVLDLFYNQTNYGFCYGIKYVSLEQLVKYKTKRNERGKDPDDIKLILTFLKTFK